MSKAKVVKLGGPKKSTICLNMIVKNEASIICDTFDNILSYINISYWVICDTGSTDNTQEVIINYFKNKNIKGELVQSIWKDFAYNRTDALNNAYNKTDYLLIFDADDRIHGKFKMPDYLTFDSYNLKLGDENFTYFRPLLINNRKKWKFVGVLHEYLDSINFKNNNTFVEGDYYISSGRFGNRSSFKDKYLKDAKILEEAYKTEPDENLKKRYAFYCAQSYKDYNDHDNAIKWYNIRSQLGGWKDEIFQSYFTIGQLYLLKKEYDNAIKYFNLSYELDNDRIEGIYNIITYYREVKNDLKEAYKYYLLIKNFNYSIEKYTPKLFIYKSVYKYLVYFEATIICFYNNDFNEGILAFKKLFNCDVNIPLLLCVIIINNIKFYDKYITKDTFTKKEIFNFIKNFTKLDKNMNNIEITMRNINDIINNTLLSKLAN
jgi:glycosyltransferase involved in cell wall biosynthesis